MKLRFKTFVMAALAVLFLSIHTYASSPTREQVHLMLKYLPDNGYFYNWKTGDITAINAKMDYLTTLTAGIDISGNTATCSGSVSIYKIGFEMDVAMSLQTSSKKSGNFSSIKSWYYNTSKTGTIAYDEDWSVTTGKYYRTRIVANVKDSSGRILETAIIPSNAKAA